MRPSAAGSEPKNGVACARCGARFDCDPRGDCWCAEEAYRMPMPAAGSSAECLCPDCLRAAVSSAQAAG